MDMVIHELVFVVVVVVDKSICSRSERGVHKFPLQLPFCLLAKLTVLTLQLLSSLAS